MAGGLAERRTAFFPPDFQLPISTSGPTPLTAIRWVVRAPKKNLETPPKKTGVRRYGHPMKSAPHDPMTP